MSDHTPLLSGPVAWMRSTPAHKMFITNEKREAMMNAEHPMLVHFDIPLCRMEADRQALLSVVQELVNKGDAVVKRWESTEWKDLSHTANYINDLRNTISKIKSTYHIEPQKP